ncbi:uncharacterized protein YndB with AHSA1/START domain [Spinactinospora alkalitolerans]|uniref:Uncharacterized protein YndB with AHSA1/START domain n=1 Tax=Spinactinospora alkalitolerans TaxID=687207 RepID=A0A852U3R7_9ACTN|nr:SRPBCC family protein [Spinactinospora alkalitolerans]NYE50227.1 uncharacterized protein YndB with AHSA1/START domain [Spinactinospora alkalitolerans]
MNGTLRRVGDTWALRFERRLAHPPEKVWRAITEPEHLNQWYPFAATELDLRVGGAIRFRDEESTELRAEITELLPPKVFAFQEFDEETGAHGLHFELVPDGEGCRLVFTHTFADRTWAAQTEAGWVRCLDALTGVLDGR